MPVYSENERLDSWKEIAAYFRRDVRTVRLWEEKEGLPVHRHVHLIRGSVYAFKPELDDWWGRQSCGNRTASRAIKLAVLPFKNLSCDLEQDFFSDGLTEEMITQLSRLCPNLLQVTACASVMRYKNTGATVEQIRQELGIDFLLQGAVRRSGRDRVCITTQLTDVRRATNLWAETFERSLTNAFAIQCEIAERIASCLEFELLPSARGMMGMRTTHIPAAFDAYLKGRYHWNKRTEQSLKKAIAYFQEAIGADPGYALPYSGLADTYAVLAGYGLISPTDAMPKAHEAALKAVELDPSLAEPHASLGEVNMYFDWDWRSAEGEFQRAIKLQRANARFHYWYANLLCALRRDPEALAEVRQALQCDPLGPLTNVWSGLIFCLCGQYESAARQCERVLDMEPEYALGRWVLGMVYQQRGRLPEAIEELRKAVAQDGGSARSLAGLGHALGVLGKRAEALDTLHELEGLEARTYVSAYDVAVVHAGLGQTDLALRTLQGAFEERSAWLPFLGVDPRLKSLHGAPAFRQLLSRMRLRLRKRPMRDVRPLSPAAGNPRPA